MENRPALLGGDPVFDNKINIVRPCLPDFDTLEPGIRQILSSGMVTKGQYLRDFEEAVARHLGAKHAVAVSSCTTGLMLAYKGLGLTGEVIMPSFTFMATVSSAVWAGLTPVFVDVNRETTNIEPEAVERAITPDTSAIVAVHNFGNPAEIDMLQAIAERHHLALIFDAAHGFGALYQNQPVGFQGNAHVFSLSPTKLLIAGEGGIVVTDSDALAQKVRMGREYGNDGHYNSAFAGMNARMPEFNAWLGLHSLTDLERAASCRNEYIKMYKQALGQLPGVQFQHVEAGNRCSYKDFSITVDPDLFGLTRDELAVALGAENLDTRKYYDPPAHQQDAYRSFPVAGDLANTIWLSEHSLSFPIWSEMDLQVIEGICLAMQRIHQHSKDIRQSLTLQAREQMHGEISWK